MQEEGWNGLAFNLADVMANTIEKFGPSTFNPCRTFRDGRKHTQRQDSFCFSEDIFLSRKEN